MHRARIIESRTPSYALARVWRTFILLAPLLRSPLLRSPCSLNGRQIFSTSRLSQHHPFAATHFMHFALLVCSCTGEVSTHWAQVAKSFRTVILGAGFSLPSRGVKLSKFAVEVDTNFLFNCVWFLLHSCCCMSCVSPEQKTCVSPARRLNLLLAWCGWIGLCAHKAHSPLSAY